ncbi:uncharacterized protein LOC62_02G002865 [Vanrija pseudolonga]|uniref:DUF1308 domain-containing protein n=1 Tax=Vanrija pseudolonga TaxID=143232 RepID=A0AAF0Y7I5_9TREE|nr:hypothetical protein LOC62_02G002865 [Vanrija pseudolonga]
MHHHLATRAHSALMAAPAPLIAAAAQLNALCADIEGYIASGSPRDRYRPPIVDWHHPDDYAQASVAGITKFLSQVAKERDTVEALVGSATPPAEYSTNLISLQGVWDAFRRSEGPLLGIWQSMDKRPGPGGGSGAGATKVDVVARGGDEWVKVNTIKDTRLLVEFREHDSYLNSDYDDSDADDSEPAASAAPPRLTNSLLVQARALVAAAHSHTRLPGLAAPRVRYVLTRLEEHPAAGHADDRIPATFAAMRELGIELDFASEWNDDVPAPVDPPTPDEPTPAADIVLDLSVLIALCCDSTHHPLPASDVELEARFRPICPGPVPRDGANAALGGGVLLRLTGASRDLRDQLRCEMVRPLIYELRERLPGGARFWVTKEVRDRLPGLVNLIGGEKERARAEALFADNTGDYWAGSRWQGDTGALQGIRVRVLEDGDEDGTAPAPQGAETPFDAVVAHVCAAMIAAGPDGATPDEDTESGGGRKQKKASRNPLRAGTVFPPPSRLPSGHTLRTMLAGVQRRATVLTNNRGAVLKVMREAGVPDGIPRAGDEGPGQRARIWVVNPSSLAEWRRLEVEEGNARVARWRLEE